MDFTFLDMTNRLLMISKRVPITSFSTVVNADEYRCRASINDALQDLALMLRIKSRMIEFTFDTVVGQRTYVMQKRIMYPFYDLRQKTGDVEIVPMVSHDFDFLSADDSSSGNPEVFYFEESSGVAIQPAAAGEVVYCVAESGLDTSTVVIQGYDTNNNYIVDKVILSTTSPVASESTFTKIESISKIVTFGTVTFRNAAGTTIYLTLSAKETCRRSTVIGLHPIPNVVETIYGKGWAQIPPLVNEYDTPVGLSPMHINAIMAGSLYHYMKYDPAIKREGLAGFKQDYYDEVTKIKGIDTNDRQPHVMRSPYWARRAHLLGSSRII